MSGASIDRYLVPAEARDVIRGKTRTKPFPLLRSSITIRKARDEVEAEPGFFRARRGRSLRANTLRRIRTDTEPHRCSFLLSRDHIGAQ